MWVLVTFYPDQQYRTNTIYGPYPSKDHVYASLEYQACDKFGTLYTVTKLAQPVDIPFID